MALQKVLYISGKTIIAADNLNDIQDAIIALEEKTIPEKTSDLTNDSGFITNAVGNLVNYFLKSETYSRDEINQKISAIPKFSIQVVSSLPTSGISATTVYLLKTGDESNNLYTEYIYVNGAWEYLGTQTVDLSGYALTTNIPTKLSELTNDAGFIKNTVSNLTNYYKKTEVYSRSESEARYQPKGDYLTEIPSEYVTDDELSKKGFLTQHQDLSGYAKKATTLAGYGITDGATKTEVSNLSKEIDDKQPKGNYLTSVPSEYVTETELKNKGYATETYVNDKISKLGATVDSTLATFIDNTDVDYAYDAETGVNYTAIRVYRDKIDGTKQFPFVVHTDKTSTYNLVMQHGFCLAINAGIFNTSTGNADGIVIQNGEVTNSGETSTHPQCLPLTIDANGNLSYASYNASADELITNGIVSAVTGFMPIIIDYREYASENWNNVSHYTENAQRQIIGQFGNGDYAIVTCEGRNYQNSDGWTIAEAQRVCKKLGLKFAYNLDGGGSTETMYGYKHINTIYDGTTGRAVPTFIVFTGSTRLGVDIEAPETFTEIDYIETSGGAYISTDIHESATIFDYETKVLPSVGTYVNGVNDANGHVFSAYNTFYPFLRVRDGGMELIRKINGTENSSGLYPAWNQNEWYTMSSTQSDGSNITKIFKSGSSSALYTSTKVNGATHDEAKRFYIGTYANTPSDERYWFRGKLSYIKLSLGGNLVHHFVAAKSNKTGIYGLLDKVTGTFYRSTSGTDFTGA